MKHFVLTADRLWDGSGAPAVARGSIAICGAHVANERAVDAELADFPGCTILPGLIDTHVHLVMSAMDSIEGIISQVITESDHQHIARIEASAASALKAGLTTVRDCGGTRTDVQTVRDRIRRGELVGPDILSCGSPITTTRGHCHWLGLVADSNREVELAAHRMLNENADFLKVMATGGNMTPSSDPMRAQYDPATLMLIADIGRRAEKHAAAHVLSRSALPSVVAANYRTIEHCDWRVEENRYQFDPDLARRIIDQNQFVGLTMAGIARRAFLPQLKNCDAPPFKRLDARFACEREMLDFGVRFTIHSDAGVRYTPIDQFALGLQTAQLELRLTPTDILQSVTATAAEAICLNDRGKLQAGKRADLIVVEGDPTRDLSCLHRIRAVMKAGQWVVGGPAA